MNLAIAASRSDLNLVNTPPRFLRPLLASLAGLAVLVASSHADDGRRAARARIEAGFDGGGGPARTRGRSLGSLGIGRGGRGLADRRPGCAASGRGRDHRRSRRATARHDPPAQEVAAERQFRLERAAAAGVPAASPFKLAAVNDKTLQVTEQDKPVLAYNYGTITGENVPENDGRRRRGCYLHPIWGLDGEILTDDFPKDHYHHHGAFWAWPHVTVDGKEYDLWTNAGIEQRFVRWLHQETGPVAAVIGVENGWFVGDRQVATERVWIRAYRTGERERSLDLEIYLVPLVPLSLQGAGGKSYGGLTVRFAVQRQADAAITVPAGKTTEDLLETPLEWADLTTQIPGAPNRSGGAVFVHPQHPNYPPTWLTRHYGPLCVGWPGVHARQYEPGQPHRLPYRIWLHGGDADVEQLKSQYAAFTAGVQAQWGGTSAP